MSKKSIKSAAKFFKKDVKLPAVHSVHLEFDKDFIHNCLQKRRATDIPDVDWPETINALYIEAEKAECELLHIKSCCDKALEENIKPYKDKLWDMIHAYRKD